MCVVVFVVIVFVVIVFVCFVVAGNDYVAILILFVIVVNEKILPIYVCWW